MEMMKVTTWFIVTLFVFGAIKVLVYAPLSKTKEAYDQ